MKSLQDRSAVALLQKLLVWYGRDDGSDDDLEPTVSQARDLVQQSEPVDESNATGKYVLYDFDQEELLSTKVCASYAAAADDAAGLNNALILKLTVPVIESEEAGITDDELCDCELPGFFCCDQCERYESDKAARQKLMELGIL